MNVLLCSFKASLIKNHPHLVLQHKHGGEGACAHLNPLHHSSEVLGVGTREPGDVGRGQVGGRLEGSRTARRRADPQQEDPQQLSPQPPQPEPQPQQEPQQEPQQPQQEGWQQHTSQQSCSSAQQPKQSPGQHPMVPAGQVAGQERDQSSPSMMVTNPTAAFISPPGGCWLEGQDVVFVIIYASSHKNVSLAACLFSSPECLNS